MASVTSRISPSTRADEALAFDAGEHVAKLALASTDERRQQHELRAVAQPKDLLDNLAGGLRGDRPSAAVAVGLADIREEQPQVLINSRSCGDGRARVCCGEPLFDGGWPETTFDVIHVGLLKLLQELAGVGREALPYLRWPRRRSCQKRDLICPTAQPRNHDELLTGKIEMDVLGGYARVRRR